MSAKISAILVVRSGALGDFVLTLPAISALRNRFPGARLELAGRASILNLAGNIPYFDKVKDLEASGFHHLFSSEGVPAAMADYLASFDLIVSWFGSEDQTYVTNLKLCNPRSLIACPLPPADGEKHIADHLICTLSPLGVTDGDADTVVPLNAAVERRAREILTRLNLDLQRPFIAVHPGSGSQHKCWPAGNFASLIDRLATDLNILTLLVEGPADRDIVAQVLDNVRRTRPLLLSDLSLAELAGILAHCHAFVGNDSGVTHLAAAVGAPVVALFGVTDPRVWGPRGKRVLIVYRGQNRLHEICVQEVLDKIILCARG